MSVQIGAFYSFAYKQIYIYVTGVSEFFIFPTVV